MHNTLTEYKQMHNKTISWNDNWKLIFICFMGRLLLEPSASSSSSFIIAVFLIQLIRWIRGSSRFEFFILLVAWGIFFEWWELDSCSPLFSYHESSLLFLCVLFPESTESNHFLLERIPRMNESHDPGRPFKVATTTSTFSASSSTAISCSLIWETLIKYDCILDLHILQSHILIYVLPLKYLGQGIKHLWCL